MFYLLIFQASGVGGTTDFGIYELQTGLFTNDKLSVLRRKENEK